MFVQFNDAARLVMRLADQEARHWQYNSIATEHLLLALLQLHDCVATRVLAKGKIDPDQVREEVEELVRVGEDCPCTRRTLTPGCRKAIDHASAAADRLGHARVGTGHLLLGLLEEAEGVAFQALCKVGINRVGTNLSRVAERVIAEMEEGHPPSY